MPLYDSRDAIPLLVLATSHVCSKNKMRKQLLSYDIHLQLTASLCLLFERTALI